VDVVKWLCIILLALALTPAHAATLYVLAWQSQLAIDTATEAATVTGGTLVYLMTAEDGMSGQVAATAPAACLTIEWQARTMSGAGVRLSQAWTADCPPVVSDLSAHWHGTTEAILDWTQDKAGEICIEKRNAGAYTFLGCVQGAAGANATLIPWQPADVAYRPTAGDVYTISGVSALLVGVMYLPIVQP
jgi:hypothetical protein